jgi:hypothetical protein
MRATAEKLQDRLAYPPRLMDEARAAAYVGFGTTKFGELVDEGIMPLPMDVDGTPRWDASTSMPPSITSKIATVIR